MLPITAYIPTNLEKVYVGSVVQCMLRQNRCVMNLPVDSSVIEGIGKGKNRNIGATHHQTLLASPI